MGRKKYSPPAVESETAFEHTSLACNATEEMPGGAPLERVCLAFSAVDGVTFGSWCETDVSKYGNFTASEVCETVALSIACVVVLS